MTRIIQIHFSLFIVLFAVLGFSETRDLTSVPQPAINMQREYVKIDTENSVIDDYFDDEQRDKAELVIKDGLLYRKRNGKLASFWLSRIFSIDPNGRFFIRHEKNYLIGTSYYHSTLTAGGPVILAGHAVIKEGKLVHITNGSGHYKPNTRAVYKTLIYLQALGVDLSDTIVSIVRPPDLGPAKGVSYKVGDFLAQYELELSRNSCLAFYHD